jgi:hypothetical protein
LHGGIIHPDGPSGREAGKREPLGLKTICLLPREEFVENLT